MRKVFLLILLLAAFSSAFTANVFVQEKAEVCPSELVSYNIQTYEEYYFASQPVVTLKNGTLISIEKLDSKFYIAKVRWNNISFGYGEMKVVSKYKSTLPIWNLITFKSEIINTNKIGLEPPMGFFHPSGLEVCPNEQIYLSSKPLANADSYIWAATNGSIQNNGSREVFYTPNGNGYVSLYTTGCNGRVSPTFKSYYTICPTTALSKPLYISEITPTSVNNPGTYFTPAIQNACHYEWTITPTAKLLPDDNNCDVLATKAGYYEISVRATNCGGVSAWTSYLIYVANTRQVIENKMIEEPISNTIYPNPANVEFFIQGISSIVQVSIYNANGLLQKTVTVNSSTTPINISALSAGVYYVKVSNSEMPVFKLLVTR